MSQENVEIVRKGYELFRARGAFVREIVTPDFAWDMTHFRGWPERQVYDGADQAESFLRDWTAAWDDWTLELDDLRDAGDKVVAIMYQRGRSKTTGALVDMSFAQVWTIRDGRQARMDMYSDPAEALEAVGLKE